MNVTNEQQGETGLLTISDLGVAAWACSELHNFILEGYEQEDYGELTKEQTEDTLNRLRLTFSKLDYLAKGLAEAVNGGEEPSQEPESESEGQEEK